MELLRRDGTRVETASGQERVLRFLYNTVLGRMLLRPLVCPWVSKSAGWILSRKLSCLFIKPFIRRNGIDMTQFEQAKYTCYNDFFTRRIKPEVRPVDMQPNHLISPCDGKLTVLPITWDGVFTVKHTGYTVTSLIWDASIARRFEGGQLLIFRLSVDDYHRYCFPADGCACQGGSIPGKLHTVMPIANDHVPVYTENSRQYRVLSTPEFGDILMVEVGALLVGRIVNHPVAGHVCRGQEKGMFEFGGSTIVLAVGKDRVKIDEDLIRNSRDGFETIVKYGEKIGTAI